MLVEIPTYKKITTMQSDCWYMSSEQRLIEMPFNHAIFFFKFPHFRMFNFAPQGLGYYKLWPLLCTNQNLHIQMMLQLIL